jgi:two-component system alkaline phosphatase synthesis response regulator PhoP
MTGERILIVDDEEHIVELVRLYLERDGFRVDSASDGAQGLRLSRELRPALLILDLMLPEVDGLEVCRQVRAESDVPIVMLTARDEDIDKIVGLELGADDYLTKPFNPRELVARIKAILRRTEAPERPEGKVLHLDDVTIDPARREVSVAGQAVELRAREFDLLHAFAEHKGMVLTREQLLSRVWGYDFYGETRTVDVHVAHLRKHLAASAGVRIVTVTGVGYKLVT